MRKFIASLFILGGPLLMVSPALAQVNIAEDICSDPTNQPAICEDINAAQDTNPIYGPDGVLTRAINVLSIIVGIVSVIVIVIAGIKFSVSQGDPGKVATNRKQIIYAIVGLAVALLSQALVRFVLGSF